MDLVPRLPARAWAVLGGDMLSAVGSGMTMPFFILYLHRVRGIDLTVAAFALATIAVASIVGNVVGGSLTDRVGARRALMVGLCVGAVGAAWFAFVHSPATAFGAAAMIGVGASISWPALDALLADAVDESDRSSVFALRHATLNVGFGFGAVIAAFIVDFASPGTFVLLYLADAATFLAVVPLLALLGGMGNRVAQKDSGTGSYGVVFADRTFLAVWGIAAAFVVVGYSQYEAALPVYATTTGDVSPHGIGIVFAANTFAVGVLQLFVLRFLAGRRRTSALLAASVAIGAAWCIVIMAAHAGGGAVAVVGFACAMAVLALGETLLSPALGPIVNDLAPDHLRGRYNGAFVLAYTAGFAIGPAMAGGGLTVGDGTPYFALLIVGAAAAGLGSLALRRHLPAALDIVGDHRSDTFVPQPEAA